MAPTSLEHNIREAVLQYIAGHIQLRKFQEWLAANAWDVRSEPGDTQRLVNDIDLLLAEFSNGHWTEQELRFALQRQRAAEVHPMVDVVGALWNEVRAPYVQHAPTTTTRSGYDFEQTIPFGEWPAELPKVESSQVAA